MLSRRLFYTAVALVLVLGACTTPPPSTAPAQAPAQATTAAPAAPTTAPLPTAEPTLPVPTLEAPTTAPTMEVPTTAPTMEAPTAAPTAESTTAPAAAATAGATSAPSGGAAPAIPHPVAGREQCLTCHQTGVGGAKQIPASHASYTNDMCQGCHKAASAAAGTPPTIPHPVAGREQCLTCHQTGVGGAKQIPASHASYTNDMCSGCHKPAS